VWLLFPFGLLALLLLRALSGSSATGAPASNGAISSATVPLGGAAAPTFSPVFAGLPQQIQVRVTGPPVAATGASPIQYVPVPNTLQAQEFQLAAQPARLAPSFDPINGPGGTGGAGGDSLSKVLSAAGPVASAASPIAGLAVAALKLGDAIYNAVAGGSKSSNADDLKDLGSPDYNPGQIAVGTDEFSTLPPGEQASAGGTGGLSGADTLSFSPEPELGAPSGPAIEAVSNSGEVQVSGGDNLAAESVATQSSDSYDAELSSDGYSISPGASESEAYSEAESEGAGGADVGSGGGDVSGDTGGGDSGGDF
jgi:hypothetical protein